MRKSKVKKKSVALTLSKKPVLTVIAEAQHIVASMTGNANFQAPNPAPTPTLADVTTEINTLDAAYKVAETRLKGSVGQMHVALEKLSNSLRLLGVYVETIANADPANASSIITSAGMVEKRPAQRKAIVFSVKQGLNSGSVILSTKAERGSVYLYEMSTDPSNPASWMRVYTGNTVKFTKSGLTPRTLVYFREAKILKGVQSDWSDLISINVA